MRFRFCLSLFPLLFAAGFAQADEIDDFILAQMKAQQIPGLTILVKQNGKVVKRKAYGVTDVEKNTPAEVDTVYETGSIGKSFTAALLMQMVQQKKLNLDDPLEKHLDAMPAAWKGVTLRHMVMHQSGLPEYALIEGIGLADTYTREKFMSTITAVPLDFQPGDMFAYSNTNFALLGYILENLAKKPFKDLIASQVFQRAGMPNTSLMAAGPKPAKLAKGYLMEGTQRITDLQSGASGSGADGAFTSTVDDLIRFAEAMESGKLLPKKTVDLMQSAPVTGANHRSQYGYGWFTRKINGLRFISHGGNSVGYSAGLSIFPDSGLKIAMMCNLYPVSGDNFTRQIAEFYDPRLKSTSMKVQRDPHPKLTDLIVRAAKAVAAGDVENRLIDPIFAQSLKASRAQLSRGAYALFAKVTKLEYLMTEEESPDKVIRYRTQIDGKNYATIFTVTPQNRLLSLALRAE